MYQIQFRLGLRPRPRWGAYSAPLDPLAGLRGPTSKGRRGEGIERGKRKGKGGVGKGRGAQGRGGDETPPLHAPVIHISGYAPAITETPSICPPPVNQASNKNSYLLERIPMSRLQVKVKVFFSEDLRLLGKIMSYCVTGSGNSSPTTLFSSLHYNSPNESRGRQRNRFIQVMYRIPRCLFESFQLVGYAIIGYINDEREWRPS